MYTPKNMLIAFFTFMAAVLAAMVIGVKIDLNVLLLMAASMLLAQFVILRIKRKTVRTQR